ncbi:MAG: hypothetical protein B7Z20_05865 [Sphingobium sp. 32-64-5]|nr:MAG: hypothetical protein B7Z20_05865 [Sphingobium sp. 32-64-5]
MELTAEILAFLAVAGFLAGVIDSMAGGGGMITLPALLASGFPPLAAVGTNKLQSAIGTGGAAYAFMRGGHMDLRRFWPPVAAAFIGSVGGAFAVQRVDPAFLAGLIPLLLVAICLYFLLAPPASEADRRSRPGMIGLSLLIGAVGFYDGFFGPGAGTFYTTIFLTMGGLGLLRATAQTKAANFASNVSGLAMMIIGGHVVWVAGLVMAGANFVGSQIGSHLAMRFGSRLIRPLLICMSLALTVKMVMDPDNPIHLYLFG